MKQVVALTIIAGCVTGSAVGGSIHEALEAVLANTPANQHVATLVFLRDQLDLEPLEAEFERTSATLQERHEMVVLALQATALGTQGELLAYLAQRQEAGAVRVFSPMWIANAIAVEVLPAEIDTIAARDDVGTVYFDFGIELIEPVEQQIFAHANQEGGIAGITTGVEAVRAPEVWNELGIDGTGVLVATLDTGVDGNHEALRDRWRGVADSRYADNPEWAWFDPFTNTTFPMDASGHGTHTMGTVCGGLPGEQVGVAPGAQWISAGVIDRGGGIETTVRNAMLAFEWMVDPDGDPATNWDVPDVCSNSWGLASFHGRPPCDPEFWTFLDAVEAVGCVIVFSAGNEGAGRETHRRPADRATDDYRTFAVGAIDANDPSWPIAGFSSRGPSHCTPSGSEAIKPEISAPGVSVRSSFPGNRYRDLSGTSMASPHVNGVVALMRQAEPGFPVDLAKQIIFDTAVDLGPTGDDNDYGWGMIDAFEAVQAVSGFTVLQFTYPHGRPNSIDPDGGTTMRVEVSGFNTEPAPDTGVLHVDDGNGFVSVPMQPVSRDVYDAVFPAVECGALVSFYVSAEDVNGVVFTDPSNAPLGVYVAEAFTGRIVLFTDNFEDDHGWVSRNWGAETGDFERGVPVNDPDWDWDPISDSDGSGKCWLTWNEFGDTDVDFGSVRLISPVFDMTAPGLEFKYDYYLNKDEVRGRDMIRVAIRDQTGPPGWTDIAVHDESGGLDWRTQVITRQDLLDAGVNLSAEMRILWNVNDTFGDNFVEAAVDAFELSAFDCPSFAPGDLDCDGQLNAFDIEPFLLALFDPDEYANQHPDCDIDLADINQDGSIDAFDISPFLELLFGP